MVAALGLVALALPSWGQNVDFANKKYNRTSKVERKGQNLPNYDEKRIHYGFFLGMNSSSFQLEHSSLFADNIDQPAGPSTNPGYNTINPVPGVMFVPGFVLNVRLSQRLDLRVLPTVAFYNRFIQFEEKTGRTVNQLNQSTFSFLELPILMKFKSLRRRNTRMYMIAGVKPGIELGAKYNELDGNALLRSNPFDFQVEYGFGLDLYYPFFKFAPEIKFSHGLVNMKADDPNKYAQNINRITTHSVTLLFNFE